MIRIFIAVTIIMLLGCKQEQHSVDETLESKLIRSLQSSSKIDIYKACIFLGELALNENQIEEIKSSLPESTCKFYLLAKRLGNTNDVTSFIDNFPNSEEQKEIWSSHSKAGYPIQFTPPYLDFLATIAITNNVALKKLVEALNHTDGAHADAMVEILAKLHMRHNERVSTLLIQNKTPKNLINLIVETSIYFSKGMKSE